MTEPMTGELLDRDIVLRHEELMKLFASSAAGLCTSLYHIRAEETFRARGFKSFAEFLSSVGLSLTNGKRYASLGPALELLLSSGDSELVRHPDLLGGISKMLNTRQAPDVQQRVAHRQAEIIRMAAAVARKRLVPFDADLIADVAERNFGWKREGLFRKRALKKAQRAGTLTPEQQRQQMLEDIERAFNVILDYRRTGWELVRELGPPTGWKRFDEVMEVLNDARDTL